MCCGSQMKHASLMNVGLKKKNLKSKKKNCLTFLVVTFVALKVNYYCLTFTDYL